MESRTSGKAPNSPPGTAGWLLLTVLLGILSGFAPALTCADPRPGEIVYVEGSGTAALDDQLRTLLERELARTHPEFPPTVLPFNPQEVANPPTYPVVALGADAVARVRQTSPGSPVLGLLVDERFVRSQGDAFTGQSSALYYDPPLMRQALLGKLILPHASRVAILAQPDEVPVYEELARQLSTAGLETELFVFSSEDRLIPTLIRALSYGDFLLAVPDSRIYNPRTIKHILLTAYRRDRIVIGPRQAYVRAGALASTYTPFPGLIAEAVAFLEHFEHTGRFPPPSHPSIYAIEVNRQVARSLNIPVPAKEALKAELDALLQATEQAPQ